MFSKAQRTKALSLCYIGLGNILYLVFLSSALAAGASIVLWGESWILILCSAVGILAGHGLRDKGRRMVAPSAEELLKADTRPPVLYLRSFNDDGHTDEAATVRLTQQGGLLNAVIALTLPQEEPQLSYSMQQVGPFIAVGRPGEKHPTLGAARMYVPEERWMEVVDMLMQEAHLVLFRAGSTPGFWWEVSNATKYIRPEQIVFWLPFGAVDDSKLYGKFCKDLSAHIPCKLPDWINGARFLYFDSDWTPHLSTPRTFLGRLTEARSLSEALDPIARRIGVSLKPPPILQAGSILSALLVILLTITFFIRLLLSRL
jgi:hypothetical protein